MGVCICRDVCIYIYCYLDAYINICDYCIYIYIMHAENTPEIEIERERERERITESKPVGKGRKRSRV